MRRKPSPSGGIIVPHNISNLRYVVRGSFQKHLRVCNAHGNKILHGRGIGRNRRKHGDLPSERAPEICLLWQRTGGSILGPLYTRLDLCSMINILITGLYLLYNLSYILYHFVHILFNVIYGRGRKKKTIMDA